MAARKDNKKKSAPVAHATVEARSLPEAGPAEAEYHSPWSRHRDREKERQLKRDAVLRMASRVFTEKGFHAASLDEVAERLNVSKPTLYYYVKNKDEILFECVRTGLEMFLAAVDTPASPGATPLVRLEAAIRAYVDVVTHDFGLCVIRVGEDPLPPESRAKLRRLKAGVDAQFRRLIEAGMADGSLAPCDPKMAGFALAGALNWIGRWFQVDGPCTAQQIADQFIPILLNGLSNGPSNAPLNGSGRHGGRAQAAIEPRKMRRKG